MGSRQPALADAAEELRYTYGASIPGSSCLFVKARGGQPILQSDSWPKALDPDRFPRPGGNESGLRLELPPPPRRGSSDLPTRRPPPASRLRQPVAYTWRDGLEGWRMAIMGNEFHTVVVGVKLATHERYMLMNGLAVLTALPLAALLAAVGAWLLAGWALRPLEALADTAECITAQGLDRRITTADEDAEFARLIRVFNDMLGRLEKSFQQATRFSADAAHELKTPLSILQGELEQGIQGAEAGSREQQVYGELLDEVQHLKSIVRKLLLLSLADAGRLELVLRPLDLTAAVEVLREDTEALAPGLIVAVEADPDIWVQADPELLGQVLQNLAGNAIKYNRPGGSIRFQLRRKDQVVHLTVTNTGAGIPPEDRARIFERFYRANKARDRAVDGVGLGLSLAREIVRVHDGELALTSTTSDATSFVLNLPLQKCNSHTVHAVSVPVN